MPKKKQKLHLQRPEVYTALFSAKNGKVEKALNRAVLSLTNNSCRVELEPMCSLIRMQMRAYAKNS